MVKWLLDGNSIYIIKSRVVQVGGRHLRGVFFLFLGINLFIFSICIFNEYVRITVQWGSYVEKDGGINE